MPMIRPSPNATAHRLAGALVAIATMARPVLASADTPVLADARTPVRVTVTNIARPGGLLLLGAYDREATWLGAETVARGEVPVPAGKPPASVVIELSLPPGRYGLSVFHDRNGNRKLDTNFIGIPTEASGASNDAPARFGPPRFDDALVTVGAESLDLTIKLR